jgi:uncharacterized DUF497 family protein
MSPKSFVWDGEKNALLKLKRGISFEAVAESLAERGPLWIDDHPRPENYPGQKLFAVLIDDYVHIVPFQETEDAIILKTIFPSRKATKIYRGSRD